MGQLNQELGPIKQTELAHLYQDDQGNLRDTHIEHMFEDCWFGRPLDSIFQNNFRLYFQVFLKDDDSVIGDAVFTDANEAHAWVSTLGLLYVRPMNGRDHIADPDLAHCNFVAMLRSSATSGEPFYCHAPTEIHAILLSAVNVLREAAQRYTDERFAPINSLPA